MSGHYGRDDRRDRSDAPPSGRLQLEESRRSFHRQVEQLKDIDDKAMRSVRTAVVVIGFVVTAVGVVTRSGRVDIGVGSAVFTGIGLLFLTVTVLAGIGTYSITEYRGRLTDLERARLERPGNCRTPNAELARIYRSWLNSTQDELTESSAFLGATLVAFTVGILNLSLAASIAAFEVTFALEGVSPVPTAVSYVVIVVSALVVIGLTTKLTIRSVNTYL